MQNHENWQIAGAKDAQTRATELWQTTLAVYEEPELEPELEPARKEELLSFVATRKEEVMKHVLAWKPELYN